MESKSHFTFNKGQRSGILRLLLLIVIFLCVYWFVDFSSWADRSEEGVLDTSSAEIVAIQKELDSLRLVKLETQKPKIYPFNPNFITDYKGYTLGMSNEEIDRLLKFREEGKWINSTADFKKVTKVSDSLLNKIGPYFKFPDWVNNPKPAVHFKNSKSDKGFVEKPYAQKIDLNEATEEQLQQVSGIGLALSKRIVSFREKLNGFSNDSQLYGVYGLDEAVVKRTLNLFTVKNPKKIVTLNVNNASASDIATIPGISFEMAKKIWEYRRLREKIDSIPELGKIDGITQRQLRLIQLYLSVD